MEMKVTYIENSIVAIVSCEDYSTFQRETSLHHSLCAQVQ